MDCLKGVAIFLVAWGHVAVFFQGHVVWLSLFAMPLFMGVSGYFFRGSLDRHTCRQLIASKSQRLLLPSLTMGCCDALMMTGSKLIAGKPLDPEYLGSVIVVGLWFLTTLFMLSAVGALLHKSFKGWKFYIAWAGVYGLLLMPMPMVWVVNELRYMLPFFVIGIACGNLRWSAVPYWLGFVALLVFALCLFHYDWSCSLYEMQPDTMTLDWHAKQLLRIVGGLAGSIVALALLRAYVQLFGLGGGGVRAARSTDASGLRLAPEVSAPYALVRCLAAARLAWCRSWRSADLRYLPGLGCALPPDAKVEYPGSALLWRESDSKGVFKGLI